MNTVVIISDSDDDQPKKSSIGSMTLLKPTNGKRKSTPKNVKRLSNRQPKNQTKLDSFFHTVKSKSGKDDISLDPLPSSMGLESSKKNNTRTAKVLVQNKHFLPLPLAKATKRTAVKGLSPKSKIASKATTRITDLKGDALWKAVVAQRKPRSLSATLNEIKPELEAESSLDDFEKMCITNQVVHSFPNDCTSVTPWKNNKDDEDAEVEKHISNYKLMIPEVIPNEPVTETAPIFRPKARITFKKKKSVEANPNTGLLTSTPTKSHSKNINHSLDLFSDSSFLADDNDSDCLCDDYGRHTVVDCSVGDFNTVMLLKDRNGQDKTCELKGFWADSPIKAGDVVNIIGEFDSNLYISIDMEQNNMIVINPDHLVSGSVIASATSCLRRSVLGNRYKGYEASNKYMLFGSILHEIFQKVLISEIRDPEEMQKLAEEIAHTSAYAHDMYSIDMEEKMLMEGISEYIPPMSAFLNKHVGTKATDRTKITNVLDIEETIWSPRYGMKGKIDVTVDCTVNGSTAIVPLELKTGKPSYSAEHKGQVTMYSMMRSEKEGKSSPINSLHPGLLLYLKDGSMQRVSHSTAAIKGLVNLRNELCHGLLQGVTLTGDKEYTVDPLPEPINQSRMCEPCPHLLTCSLHQQVFKDFEATPDHVMEKLVPETLSHLTQAHLEYFSKWCKLLLVESSTDAKWKTIRDLWTRSVKERISHGVCLNHLTVSECMKTAVGSYKVMLTRSDTASDVKLAVGGMVVVSEADSKSVIVTTACIVEISASHVCLLMDRNMPEKRKYCIDKYDSYSGDGAGFTNLARLMENTTNSQRLRELVIDGKQAEFKSTQSYDGLQDKVETITNSLNTNQLHAVKQGLLAKDYVVIKGYPGTGKTSTIVTLVQAFRAQGLSVLVTSYTHSAVDNILLKLKEKGVEFIRLGRASRIHPDLAGHSSESLTRDLRAVDQVSAFYSQFHVVGTTCLGINHPMISKRTFDVCIVDEASQILQPICLGPLFYASKFILVGDDKQLPPLIKSSQAKSMGMEQTLLDILGRRSSDSVIELTEQYRMNEEITRLSNEMTYNNKLICGTEAIASDSLASKLSLTVCPMESKDDLELWTQEVCGGSLAHSVVLLNTSHCALSPSKKTTIHSNTEAAITSTICCLLTKMGVKPGDIGVITPYRAQVQLLKDLLGITDVEVNTVDQYQGRDKSVIVISFARTARNSTESIGKEAGILADLRRLNVAITRAKHKLILVGNKDILCVYAPLHRLIQILKPHQIVNLPPGWQPS